MGAKETIPNLASKLGGGVQQCKCPIPSCPHFVLGSLNLQWRTPCPRNTRNPCMHTWTETQDRKEMVFRKNIQPGFSIIFERRSFLCSKYISFPSRTSCSTSCGNAKGWVCGPVVAQQNSPAPCTHAGHTGPVQYPWLTPNVCYQRHHTTAPVREAFQRVWQHLIYPLGKFTKKNFNFFSRQKKKGWVRSIFHLT